MATIVEQKSNDLLSVTVFFSILTHAVLILGVSFKMPDIAARSNTDNFLEVVLINNSNKKANDDAELVSSQDNMGGGSDDREGSTPLPFKTVTPSPIESIDKTAKRVTKTTIVPDQLFTADSGQVQLQRFEPEISKKRREGTEQGRDQITLQARRAEMKRLLAKTSKEWEDYQKRPKKTFLGPNTKGDGAANYLNAWKQRVVEVGNANYPNRIRENNLHGSLIMSIEINRNGTIHSIKITEPSKHKILNDAATQIVRDASPFSSFPEEEFFKKTDILVITRAFHFLPGNRFDNTARGRG